MNRLNAAYTRFRTFAGTSPGTFACITARLSVILIASPIVAGPSSAIGFSSDPGLRGERIGVASCFCLCGDGELKSGLKGRLSTGDAPLLIKTGFGDFSDLFRRELFGDLPAPRVGVDNSCSSIDGMPAPPVGLL